MVLAVQEVPMEIDLGFEMNEYPYFLDDVFDYAAAAISLGLTGDEDPLFHHFKSAMSTHLRITDERPGTASHDAIIGAYLLLDGSDDRVNLPTDKALVGTGDFTICAWIKTSISGTGVILQKGSHAGHGYSLRVDNGDLRALVNDGVGAVSTVGGTHVNTGVWVCVIATFDRDGNATTYINNGAANNTADISARSASLDNANKLSIGSSEGDYHFLGGGIRDVRVYSKLLPADERTHYYTHGKSGTDPTTDNCLLWQKLEESSQTTLCLDSSGQEAQGTLQNADLSVARAKSSDVPHSHSNAVGHTVSDGVTYYQNDDGTGLIASGVIIPRDESSPTKCAAYLSDGTQADLQKSGKAKNSGKPVESNCLTGNGSNSYVRKAISVSSPTSGTICLWVKDLGSSNSRRWISVGSAANRGFDILKIANGFEVIIATDISNFTKYTYTGGAITSVTHIAVTCSGTTVVVYMDGEIVAVTTSVTGSGFSGTQSSIANATLFATSFTTASEFSNACVADARYFTSAKSQAEIQAIRDGGDDAENCLVNWPLSEGGNADTVAEVSGNDNDGTLNNFDLSAAWSNSQDKFHRNLVQGFSVANKGRLTNARVSGDVYGFRFKSTSPSFIFLVDSTDTGNFAGVSSGGSGADALAFATKAVIDGVEYTSLTRDQLDGFFNDVEHEIFFTMAAGYTAWGAVEWGDYDDGSPAFDLENGYCQLISVNGETPGIDYSETTLIPAINSTTDANGNPLSNPAGSHHNNAETKVDLNPNDAPGLDGVASDWHPSDTESSPHYVDESTTNKTKHSIIFEV